MCTDSICSIYSICLLWAVYFKANDHSILWWSHDTLGWTLLSNFSAVNTGVYFWPVTGALYSVLRCWRQGDEVQMAHPLFKNTVIILKSRMCSLYHPFFKMAMVWLFKLMECLIFNLTEQFLQFLPKDCWTHSRIICLTHAFSPW